MAYIGNEPIVGQWRKLDNISAGFNGSSKTFTTSIDGVSVTAGTVNQLIISLNSVIQNPGVDYTVSTNSITFTTAPASGLSFFGIYAGDTLNIGVPSDGSVTNAKVAAGAAIAFSKLANVSATDKLLGRSSAGAGAIEEITCTAAGRALIDDADAAAQRTTLGLGALATSSNVGTALTDPVITGTILEDVYTISDGAAFEVDPGNGSVQLITLGASRTPKATNFAAGDSITMMIDDGTAYTITWTDSTWGTGGVTWVGGTAPTLATSGYTVLQFWKVGTKVYGAKVGEVA